VQSALANLQSSAAMSAQRRHAPCWMSPRPPAPAPARDEEIAMKRTLIFAATALFAAAPAYAGRQDAELELTQARSAVEAAERADAAEYAPTELNVARDMLARAEGSYDDRDFDDSGNEAELAAVDARLAEARARQQKAEIAATEVEAAIDSLRVEVTRNQ
jgi:non-homologous end joining protein Ku